VNSFWAHFGTQWSQFNTETRHRASTSTRWHLAFGIHCHSNETRLQIGPIVHNRGHPLPLPQVTSGSVQQCGSDTRGRQTDKQTHTYTRVTNIHFASSTTHAKCIQTSVSPLAVTSPSINLAYVFLVLSESWKTMLTVATANLSVALPMLNNFLSYFTLKLRWSKFLNKVVVSKNSATR